MFNGANDFNKPIGAWNTSAVTNMSWLFRSRAFNQPIGNWVLYLHGYPMSGLFQTAKAIVQSGHRQLGYR